MDYEKYIKGLKSVYEFLLEYLACDEECNNNYYYNEIINILENQLQEKRDSLGEFLTLINKIAKNYYRFPAFFTKIERILSYLEIDIKQTFTNIEIFQLFKSNKRVLLFLIHKRIIQIDDTILSILHQKNKLDSNDFIYYFFNEIKEKVSPSIKESIESQLIKIDKNIFDKFQEKCENGENDSYLCALIRQDSIQEFVQYVNEENISLTSNIKYSIFETNSFLINKRPTIIEYAAFYGSIQIFQYLRLNDVELNPSLWLYSIHSKNAELINFLEDNLKQTNDSFYEECFIESVKCHHNDIAEYFLQNYLKKSSRVYYQQMIIRYYNYYFFESIFEERFPFFFLYKYNHNEIINLYMEKEEKNHIKEAIL